jgi:hypothetical protein
VATNYPDVGAIHESFGSIDKPGVGAIHESPRQPNIRRKMLLSKKIKKPSDGRDVVGVGAYCNTK